MPQGSNNYNIMCECLKCYWPLGQVRKTLLNNNIVVVIVVVIVIVVKVLLLNGLCLMSLETISIILFHFHFAGELKIALKTYRL